MLHIKDTLSDLQYVFMIPLKKLLPFGILLHFLQNRVITELEDQVQSLLSPKDLDEVHQMRELQLLVN